MSDSRVLLDRITAFRQRLEGTPPLLPVTPADDSPPALAATAAALADRPALLNRSLRALTSAGVADGPVPLRLTARARLLLEQARGLVGVQRELASDPLVAGLCLAAELSPDGVADPLAVYHRETVALTEAALRMAQLFPESAEVQGRMCDGLEAMLRAVRDRLGVAQTAVVAKRKTVERLDGLSRHLAEIAAGKQVDLGWFARLSEQLLEEARAAGPLQVLTADPQATAGLPGSDPTPAPARFVAAHALTVAQVVARVVGQDFEWAGRPMVPVMTALLMDVGMVKVPGAVLANRGELSAEDRRLIDRHPSVGAGLIYTLAPDAAVVAEAVAAHHERPDGTGYPNAIRGDDVPTLARLLAVCDQYAACIADRPHRPAHDPRTALTDCLMAAEQGKLDRDFSEYLLALSYHPVGTVVELADGRVGVVVATHTNRADLRAGGRPVVAVLTDRRGQVLPRPEVVDLLAADRGSVARVPSTAERTRLLARDYPDLC